MRVLSFLTTLVVLSLFATAAYAKPADLCAHIDADLEGDYFGVVKVFAHLDLCLCLSQVPEFIETNVGVIEAVAFLGPAFVIAEIEGFINNSPGCSPVKSHSINKHSKRGVPECRQGYSLCGVQSTWSRKSWECVDTKNDLWSCGGCTAGYLGQAATGVDCTAIEGAQDVVCTQGACKVLSCNTVHTPAVNGTSCIPEEVHAPHAVVPIAHAVAGVVIQSI